MEKIRARVSPRETVARTASEEADPLRSQLVETSSRTTLAEVRVAELEKLAHGLNAELAPRLSKTAENKPGDISHL